MYLLFAVRKVTLLAGVEIHFICVKTDFKMKIKSEAFKKKIHKENIITSGLKTILCYIKVFVFSLFRLL